jgi:tRNA threonylcarbamoyladenosine biosynthesis protein TsaE
MDTSTGRSRSVVTRDEAGTRRLGAVLAAVAEPGDVLCLSGELGAGKTQLAKGFGRGLGVTGRIASPSFVLMSEHAGRLPLFHLDLYRLHDATEAMEDGLLDDRQAEGVTIIEWADRLGPSRPASRLDVRIDGVGDEPRRIELAASDDRHERYLAVVA